MNEKYMSIEERAEYATLVDEVLNGDRTVDDGKVQRYRNGLVDAVKAQRAWAEMVLLQAQMDGLRKDLKQKSKDEAVAIVAYDGRLVGKTMRAGRRRRDDQGRVTFQQALLQDFSWNELTEWLDMISAQIGALLVNKHIADRLLTLREKFPETHGPAEACALLGTTVETYLGVEEAA